MKIIKSDWAQLSLEDHEVKYILRVNFGKSESEANQKIVKKLISEFKLEYGGSKTKKYTKQDFYDWVQQQPDFIKLD